MGRRLCSAILATLAVSACIKAPEYAQGPLELSYAARRAYHQWLDSRTPGFFAVSKDGTRYGYSFCPDATCRGNAEVAALESCRQRIRPGQDCIVYGAMGRPVFKGDEPYRIPDVGAIRLAPQSIRLSPRAAKAYQGWQSHPGAASFAVSPDGKIYGWTACREQACHDQSDAEAIWICRQAGAEQCLIYGRRGKRVVGAEAV